MGAGFMPRLAGSTRWGRSISFSRPHADHVGGGYERDHVSDSFQDPATQGRCSTIPRISSTPSTGCGVHARTVQKPNTPRKPGKTCLCRPRCAKSRLLACDARPWVPRAPPTLTSTRILGRHIFDHLDQQPNRFFQFLLTLMIRRGLLGLFQRSRGLFEEFTGRDLR